MRHRPVDFPADFHARVLADFRDRIEDGVIRLTATELCRAYAHHPRRPGALTRERIHGFFLSRLADYDLVRRVPRPGKPPWIEFRAGPDTWEDDRLRGFASMAALDITLLSTLGGRYAGLSGNAGRLCRELDEAIRALARNAHAELSRRESNPAE